MAGPSSDCPHKNRIIDIQQGDEICTDCGLITDRCYINQDQNTCDSYRSCKSRFFILEMLERLCVPNKFSEDIHSHFKKEKTLTKSKLSRAKKDQMICFSAFKILNNYGIPISLKDINCVSGINTADIFNHQNSVVNPTHQELFDKVCSLLNIEYKLSSVIKRSLPPVILSGHNPSTIVGAVIYKYTREKKLKYSVKQIANVLNISPVSIQRYINKNELSSGAKVHER